LRDLGKASSNPSVESEGRARRSKTGPRGDHLRSALSSIRKTATAGSQSRVRGRSARKKRRRRSFRSRPDHTTIAPEKISGILNFPVPPEWALLAKVSLAQSEKAKAGKSPQAVQGWLRRPPHPQFPRWSSPVELHAAPRGIHHKLALERVGETRSARPSAMRLLVPARTCFSRLAARRSTPRLRPRTAVKVSGRMFFRLEIVGRRGLCGTGFPVRAPGLRRTDIRAAPSFLAHNKPTWLDRPDGPSAPGSLAPLKSPQRFGLLAALRPAPAPLP